MGGAPAKMASFAVVPAAGQSERMGCPKLLLPWGDTTVIGQVVAVWRASRVRHVLAVCRPYDTALQTACREAGATVVVPDEPPAEMKDSVRCALQFAERQFGAGEEDVWLLAPADMPRLSQGVVDQLLATHDPARPAILTPVIRGERGHPVLFPWGLAAAIDQLGADEGIDALVRRYAARRVPVDQSGILQDLDTPADYAKLRPRQSP